MAYIGNIPAESFASFEKQVFTIVNSQTAYTLSHSVVNENDIRLVVNNVVQEPGSGKAYTASGTTLTLSAALTNGTDTMYCVFLGRALQTVNAPNASVGSDQTAPTIITGQTAETSIATDDTILIHDTSASALRKMTRANFVSGIGGTNTPAFEAKLNTQINLSNGAVTKMIADNVIYDTASAYSTSNGRFTPQTNGKFYVYGMIVGTSSNSSDLKYTYAYLKKNGTTFKTSMTDARNSLGLEYGVFISGVADMNGSSDYVELFGQVETSDGSGQAFVGGNEKNYFGAYKIIT